MGGGFAGRRLAPRRALARPRPGQDRAGSALPMSTGIVIVRSVAYPGIRYPMIAATLSDEVASDPDVLMAAPFPESWRPDITMPRFRDHFHPGRGRCHVDVDI